MKTFKDSKGREWVLNLTWSAAERIAASCERPDSTPENKKTYDLFDIANSDQVQFLLLNDEKGRFNLANAKALVNILYVLCEQQCKQQGVSDVDFGGLMESGTFSSAYEALMGEIENFIQSPEQKKLYQNLMSLAAHAHERVWSAVNQDFEQKLTALDASMTQHIKGKMDAVWQKMEEEMVKVDAENGTTPSSNTPPSSGSVQIL